MSKVERMADLNIAFRNPQRRKLNLKLKILCKRFEARQFLKEKLALKEA